MLKKTISVFILVAIITATIICGNLTVFAEESQGDCVVNYVDMDGNIVATQYYNFGEQITGLEAFDSYIQTSILLTEEYGSESYYSSYDGLTEFDLNEIVFNSNNDIEKVSTNILSIYVRENNEPNYYINEQHDIIDFSISYLENDIEKTVSFNEMSFNNSIYYYYGENINDSPIRIQLHDNYTLDFFSVEILKEDIELLSISINDELRYEEGISYKQISKDELPQIYVPSITFIVPYKAAPVPTPGDGDTDDEIDTDIADETTNPNILEKAKADWDNMWREIKAFFDKVGNWFRDTWQKISDLFHKLSDLNKNEDIDDDNGISESDAANNVALLHYVF